MELDCPSNNIKRSTSCLSIRSRRSADSGYDLEDPVEGSTMEKSTPQAKSESKAPPSGSDSGEEMYWSEQEDLFTGSYMALTESGAYSSDLFFPNANSSITNHFTKSRYMSHHQNY